MWLAGSKILICRNLNQRNIFLYLYNIIDILIFGGSKINGNTGTKMKFNLGPIYVTMKIIKFYKIKFIT